MVMRMVAVVMVVVAAAARWKNEMKKRKEKRRRCSRLAIRVLDSNVCVFTGVRLAVFACLPA